MKQFDNIVIGFGKGGKTLAGALASAGQSTALIESSERMFGGTCINVACIPTKSLENSARLSAIQGGSFTDKAQRYFQAIEQKRRLTAALRQKNFNKAAAAGVEVLVGTARFLDSRTISVGLPSGGELQLQGERIFINTGARPFLPPIPGLDTSRRTYTSETMMELDELPARLAIIGGGYIGLEFASYYANFGSQVTVIQDSLKFLPREDGEVSEAVLKNLEERGITLLRGAAVQKLEDRDGWAEITVQTGEEITILQAEAVLVATGRRPNIEGLHLEAAGVAVTERGGVQTDEFLRTTAPHIWAMGDVTGGLQFTYISLDDSRIVKSQVLGGDPRTTENRGAVPYSVFLDPPLSRVGLTEEEARQQGYSIKTAKLPTAAIPKAQVLQKPAGMLKAVVDDETGRILGAHLFCAESHELINLLKLAIDHQIPYTSLRDAIYTHPTMGEALNDLFAAVQ